jgi:hypothetical protein
MKTPRYMRRFPGLKKWLDKQYLKPVERIHQVVLWSSITDDRPDGDVYLLNYNVEAKCIQVFQWLNNSFAGDRSFFDGVVTITAKGRLTHAVTGAKRSHGRQYE